MLKDADNLRSPDPYYSGEAGFIGSTLEQLHQDMSRLELPEYVPHSVRRYHDGVRNAYIYSYFSLRQMFAHGSDTVLNAPMFLGPFEAVTSMIAELFNTNVQPPR